MLYSIFTNFYNNEGWLGYWISENNFTAKNFFSRIYLDMSNTADKIIYSKLFQNWNLVVFFNLLPLGIIHMIRNKLRFSYYFRSKVQVCPRGSDECSVLLIPILLNSLVFRYNFLICFILSFMYIFYLYWQV